jgi:hypothetical protein
MVDLVLPRRVRVHRLAPSVGIALEQLGRDPFLVHHLLPEAKDVVGVGPDVPEIAGSDADPDPLAAQHPSQKVGFEHACADDPLLGCPRLHERVRRDLLEGSEDVAKRRRPDASERLPPVSRHAEVRQQVVVDRLAPRDQADTDGVLWKAVEQMPVLSRLGEAAESRQHAQTIAQRSRAALVAPGGHDSDDAGRGSAGTSRR